MESLPSPNGCLPNFKFNEVSDKLILTDAVVSIESTFCNKIACKVIDFIYFNYDFRKITQNTNI